MKVRRFDVNNQTTDQINYIAEKFLLDTIRAEHPEWINEHGECPKCEEYYESLSDIVMIEGVSS